MCLYLQCLVGVSVKTKLQTVNNRVKCKYEAIYTQNLFKQKHLGAWPSHTMHFW